MQAEDVELRFTAGCQITADRDERDALSTTQRQQGGSVARHQYACGHVRCGAAIGYRTTAEKELNRTTS